MPYSKNEFPPELRTYVCDGTHALTHQRVLADNLKGYEVIVDFCADQTCATFTCTTCSHVQNRWHYAPGKNDDGEIEENGSSALLCDFCGKDGT